ncbi:MAG: beta-propeller domain-containing protein [Proteobacteria bacterium]|nr:beta-propeller domain-containing protein [Pseudomonadota bacterium]
MGPRSSIYLSSVLLFAGLSCTMNSMKSSARSSSKSSADAATFSPGKGFALESLDRYESCDELKNDFKIKLLSILESRWQAAQYYNEHRPIYSEADSAVMNSAKSANTSSPSASTGEVSTNVQVKGVDEADEIKMNSRAIFIADNQQMPGDLNITMVTKNPLATAGIIKISSLTSPQLYTVGDQLVVTGMQQAPFTANNFNVGNRFTVKVYNVSGAPSLQNEFFMSSQPVDSRMIGSKLFVVLRDQLKQKKALPYPSDKDLSGSFEAFTASINLDEIFDFSSDSIAGIKCSAMMKVPSLGESFQFQRVISYDVSKGAVIDEVAIPGSDTGIYMTNQTLYTFGRPILPYSWVNPSDAAAKRQQIEFYERANNTLVIKKIALDSESGKLMPMAIGSVAGHLKSFDSQWAFNEIAKDGELFLSVVTSTGDVRDQTGKNPASNHLVVLRQQTSQLVEAASVKDFGQNEDVRSVRYIGSRAYVVTFKRTDPLFTIELSDPLAPKIVGELKIPGFSLYLNPHADNRLLGVGYQTEESGETDINRAFFQGILFQLFDILDPAASSRLHFIELGKRGSYSEANQDHHAFYYDAENALTGIPVVLFDDGLSGQPSNGQVNNNTRVFSGAILYRILNDKLEEVKRVSHIDLLGPTCKSNLRPLTWTNPIVGNPEVRRIFRDGNTIFAVSNFGIKTIDASTFADLGALKLERPDCRPQMGGGGFE